MSTGNGNAIEGQPPQLVPQSTQQTMLPMNQNAAQSHGLFVSIPILPKPETLANQPDQFLNKRLLKQAEKDAQQSIVNEENRRYKI